MSSASSTPRLRKHPNGRWYGVVRRDGHEVTFSTKTTDKEKATREAARMLRIREEEWNLRAGLEDAATDLLGGDAPSVAPPPPAAAPGRAPIEHDLIRNKLRVLGGAAPVSSTGEAPAGSAAPPPAGTPDEPEVLAPGVREEEKKKAADAEGDTEANELMADMLAGAIVGGHQRAVKRACENFDPPKRAAEPNETMLEWERAGIRARLRLAMSNKGLSPNAKLFVGIVGVTVSMIWNAEEIPANERPRPPQQAPQPAAQTAPQPAQNAQQTTPVEQRAPERQALALVSAGPGEAAAGRFQ